MKEVNLDNYLQRRAAGLRKYENNDPDSSQYRGVCWDIQKNKWKASIKCRGKKIHIGLFCEEVDAAKAYDEKAKELHGIKAKLNFI